MMRNAYEALVQFTEKKFRVDARYFLSGGFWLSLGQGFTIFFGLISTVLFAHFLTETEYGIYKYLLGLAALLSTFSLTGLGQSILQTAAKGFHGFYKETLRINLLYSLCISLVAAVGAIYYYLNENITLALGCLAIAVLQPLINTFQFLPAYLIGTRKFQTSTKVNVLRMFFVTITSVTTLFFTNNVLLLFVAYLGSNLVINILSQYFYTASDSTTPESIFAKYISYAKNTSVRNIISNVAQKSDSVIIFTQLGATELAIYAIATVIPEQIKGSVKNLTSLLIPKYSQHDDITKVKKSVPKRSLQLLLILLLITIIYIFAAPYLFDLLFPKYENAVFYSQLLALTIPAFVLLVPYSVLLSQLEEEKLYKITLYSSIFQILISLGFILTLGLIGAIIAKIVHRIIFLIVIYSHLYSK
jgi:O-antigen/teichoic acid export membrane protein